MNTDYAVPRDESEQVIVNIWQELLGIDRVGIHDDFFELGGHSLFATMICARIQTEFGVSASVKDIFEQRTIEALGCVLSARKQNAEGEALATTWETGEI